MTPKQIMQEILEKRETAATDLTSIDPRIRAGREGAKRAAEADLIRLERLYKDNIINYSVLIAVDGKYASDFANLAMNEFKTVSVNYLHALDSIVDNVTKRGGRGFYKANEHWMVMDELNKLKMLYNIVSLPVLEANFGTGEVPLYDGVKAAFSRTYGNSLYSLVTKGKIAQEALKANFQGNLLPVVLYNCGGEVDTSILPTPVETLLLDKKIDTDFVKDTLLNIKNKLKNTKE